jgi:hypothetical protein
MRVFSANAPMGSRRKPVSSGEGELSAAMRPSAVALEAGTAWLGVRGASAGRPAQALNSASRAAASSQEARRTTACVMGPLGKVESAGRREA